MSKPRDDLARSVRQQLVTTEKSNERSIAEAARLLSLILDTGLTIGAALEVTHDIVEDSFAGVRAGIEKRRHFLSAHQRLAALAERMNIDVTATGGAGSKDPSKYFTSGESTVVEIGRAA